MLKRSAIFMAAACLVFVAPATAEPKREPIVLWKELVWGMTPEEVAPIAENIDGVRKARVRKPSRSNPERWLKISHNREKIPIAGMPFEFAPAFKDGRLNQVWLVSKNQCEEPIQSAYNTLSGALSSKYPSPVFGSGEMTRSEVLGAERKARRSEEPQLLSYGFSSESVVVLLSFHIRVEKPPAYPAYSSGLAISLWRLSRTRYDQRKAECEGTGNKRMDVAITYFSRAKYEAEQKRLIEALDTGQANLADQL